MKTESLMCLETLRDVHADSAEKEQAFTRMMWLDSGWWGHGSLMDFALACAKGFVHYKLAPHGIAIDRIDYEDLANEALLVLYYRASDIRDSPRSWLAGTIKNLIRSEVRRSWTYLTSQDIPEELCAPEPTDQAPEETGSLSMDERMLNAIRRLTPALRAVAELYFIHQIPRDELAEYLGLSEGTLRKRVQRVRVAIQREITVTPCVSAASGATSGR